MSVLHIQTRFLHFFLIVVALALVSSACGTTTTEITAADLPAARSEALDTTDAPAGAETPAETATQEPAQEPTAEPVPTARVVPLGFTDYNAGDYRTAMPGSWNVLTDVDDMNEMLDSAGAVTGLPANAIEQYRSVLQGGNAIVGLGPLGDNFNAFRQRGTDALLSNPEQLAGQLQAQFETFAQNVAIDASPRFIGQLSGLYTKGQYDLNGQTLFLYQFGTANGDHVYFFTVTLFTGADAELADQIFNSISFDD